MRGVEEQTVCLLHFGLFAHEEDEIGARAHRAVGGGVGCSTLVVARVLHAYHRRAAAVQVEGSITAELCHLVGQIVEIDTGRITGLVGGVDDERAVGFPADGGSGALLVFRVEREAGQRLAVFYQHIAAATGVGNTLPHIVAERGDGQRISDLHGLEARKCARVGRLFRDGQDESTLRNGARGGVFHDFRRLQRHFARKRQLSLAAGDRREDNIIGSDRVLCRGVVVARVKTDAVCGRERLIIKDLRAVQRASGHVHMHVRVSDDGGAAFGKANRVDAAARAQNAVRNDKTVGNAGRHIKKRAVHASDQAEIFIFQIGCDLAHGASAVERRAIDHHRTDGEVGFVCKHVLLQEVLRPVRRFLRMGHFDQIDARSQRHRPF